MDKLMMQLLADLVDDTKKDSREKPYKMMKFSNKAVDQQDVEKIKEVATTIINTKIDCEKHDNLASEQWGLDLNHTIRYEQLAGFELTNTYYEFAKAVKNLRVELNNAKSE